MILLWLSAVFACVYLPVAVSYGCIPRDYGLGSIVCVCNATYCDTVEQVTELPQNQYVMITSSMAGDRFTTTYGTFDPETDHNYTDRTLYIDRTKKYQPIHGFGGAVTDSAGINVLSLSLGAQKLLLNAYFFANGLEYSLIRVPIGGTDFSTRPYTYDDVEGDTKLEFFAMPTEDTVYKMPLIQKALTLTNHKLKIFGTAWTAPPWMKTNKAIDGIGFLEKQYFGVWAQYHKKFLDAYREQNITFWGLTTGNEPANGFTQYIKINDMGWIPPVHARWIAELGALLKSDPNYEHTKIIIVDDQRVYFPWIPCNILSNKNASQYIDGVGVHYYTDAYVPASVLSELHDKHPEKFILATEACEGSQSEQAVIMGSWDRAENYLTSIIDDLNNWCTGWMDWNIALNMDGGPTWAKNYVDSPIIVNATADEFYKQPMFYALGHFAKYVRPGSVRIHSNCSIADLKQVVFERPDNSTCIAIFNPTDNNIPVTIHDERYNQDMHIEVQNRSINTIIYW